MPSVLLEVKTVPSFKTQFDPSERVYAEPGNPIKTLYGPIFDKDGIMDLVETGKANLYDEIQSHADSVDIHVLLKRYAETGDPALFSRVQGAYGDFTQMPTTFAGALNTLIAAEQYFNGLPVDVRAQFGHSFQQFIASMDKSDFATRMGIAPDVSDVATSSPGPGGNTGEPAAPVDTTPDTPSVPSAT